MTNNEVLSLDNKYALPLLRRLADDDAFRTLYEQNPAQALRDIGVPDEIIGKLPPDYKNIKLASKLIFQTALYQVIDDVAAICLCQKPPQIALGFGEAPAGRKKLKTTPFEAS